MLGLRRCWLTDHPLCVACQAHQQLTPANVVDHIRKTATGE